MSDPSLVALSAEHDLSGFDCGIPELDRWLIDHALASQKADLARTYLVLDGGSVAAYVSLTTGSIRPEAGMFWTKEGQAATDERFRRIAATKTPFRKRLPVIDGGHVILPGGGHRISPVAATISPHGRPVFSPPILF